MNHALTPVLHALGLCARARALTFGVPMLCEAMRTGRPPRLVLIASDVSDNTRKRLLDKCSYYHVPYQILPFGTGELAHAVGKTSGLGAVGVADENFCRLISSAIERSALLAPDSSQDA